LRGGNSPSTTWRSVRQTPQYLTRTSTSPEAGSGAVTSIETSGLVSTLAGFCSTHASMTAIIDGFAPGSGVAVRSRPDPEVPRWLRVVSIRLRPCGLAAEPRRRWGQIDREHAACDRVACESALKA